MALCSVYVLKRLTLSLVLLSLLLAMALNSTLLCSLPDQRALPGHWASETSKTATIAGQGVVRENSAAAASKWLARALLSQERTAPQAACPPVATARGATRHASMLAAGSVSLSEVEEGSLATDSISDRILHSTDFTVATLVAPLNAKNNDTLSRLSLVQRKGVSLLSLATEHMFSSGEDGVLLTLDILKSASVHWLGLTFKHSEVLVLGGVKVGFLAFCGVHGECLDSIRLPFSPAKYSSKEALSAVNALRVRGVDIIVAMIRWGRDTSYFPDETALVIARHLALLGVGVVVGSHPFLQQDHAYFGETLVLFSPGAFHRPASDTQLCWQQDGRGGDQFSRTEMCRRVHPNLRQDLKTSEQSGRIYHIQLYRSGPAVAQYLTLPLQTHGSVDVLTAPTANAVWNTVCGEEDLHCLSCEPL